MKNWYGDDLIKLACCFHWLRYEEVGADWSADDYIAKILATGIKCVTIEAKDSLGYRYYEGEHGIKHPLVNWDYYGERSRVLKENDIKVIAYFGLGDDSAAFEKRPDFRKVRPGRKLSSSHKPDTPDLSNLYSPYYKEIFLTEVLEFLDAYSPDALWLDIFSADPYWDMSYDPWTKAMFQDALGRPLLPPDEDPNPAETAEFFIRKAEEVRADIVRRIKSAHPNVLVAIASSLRYPRKEGIVTDFLSRDTLWGYCGNIFESGYYARLWGATGHPSEIISPTYRWWGEKDTKSYFQMEREAMAAIAAGTTYMCYIAPSEKGVLNSATCQKAAKLNQSITQCSEWLRTGTIQNDLILFTCSESEEAYSKGFLSRGANNDHLKQTNPRFFAQDFECASLFLQRNGYLFGAQTEKTIEAYIGSQNVPLILAPNLCSLSEKDKALLIDFVMNGGSLMICGDVDKNFAAEIGLTIKPRTMPNRSYARLLHSTDTEAQGYDIPIPIDFCDYEFAGSTPVIEVANIRHEERFMNGDWSPWGHPDPDDSGWRDGASCKSLGKGKILYYAFNPFLAYAIEPHHLTESLLKHGIHACLPDPSVKIQKNLPIEMIYKACHQAKKSWIHFINHSEAFEVGRNMTLFPGSKPIEQQDVEFIVKGPMPSIVRLQPSSTVLKPYKVDEHHWGCKLPSLNAHSIVEFA